MSTSIDRIKEMMDDLGCDQVALGKSAGASKSVINQLLSGKIKKISPKYAYNLNKKHGYNPEWVMFGSLPKYLLPSPDTQPELNPPESRHDKDKDSAVLLKFPKMSSDTITAPDNYIIRQYAAGGAMGHGLTLPDQPGVIENWSVSREWLHKNVRNITGVQNLCIVTGFGPSMQPMYNPGDPLLVDTGVKQVIADGVYFFRVGENGYIKQLQMIPTETGVKYVAKSKNPDFDPFDITEAMDFEILGKVVRVWCGTDF